MVTKFKFTIKKSYLPSGDSFSGECCRECQFDPWIRRKGQWEYVLGRGGHGNEESHSRTHGGVGRNQGYFINKSMIIAIIWGVERILTLIQFENIRESWTILKKFVSHCLLDLNSPAWSCNFLSHWKKLSLRSSYFCHLT